MRKKKNDNDEFRVNSYFLKAYDITLEKAATSKYGKSDFRCTSEYPSKFFLDCENCPFCCYLDDGGVLDRTFKQWQKWFYKLTGVKDNRPKKSFMKKNE